ADVAFTANVGRAALSHRLAVIAASSAEAREQLAAFAEGRTVPGVFCGQADPASRERQRPEAPVADAPGSPADAPASPGDWRPLLEALAGSYVRGDPVDWAAFYKSCPLRRLPLPTYPFQ